MKLSKLTKPKLDKILNNANFTEDEEKIFIMLAKDMNLEQISQRLLISKATLSRKIKDIKYKIMEVNKDMSKNTVPIWEKVTLTVEEAAEYSNIGINKIYELIKEPSCSFVFYIGKGRRLIKRKEFERYIEKSNGI